MSVVNVYIYRAGESYIWLAFELEPTCIAIYIEAVLDDRSFLSY